MTRRTAREAARESARTGDASHAANWANAGRTEAARNRRWDEANHALNSHGLRFHTDNKTGETTLREWRS